MKKLITGMLLVATTQTAALGAQEIQREIGGFGNWFAAEVTDHSFTRKEACLAFTEAKDKSLLQVYAERQPEREGATRVEFAEPTILVLPQGEVEFVRGVLEDEKKRAQIHLVLASTEGETPALGLIARVDDRKGLVQLLKKANTATVTLVNARNKTTGKLVFSLRGSTKTIDSAFSACELGLE